MVNINIKIDDELHKKIKLASIMHDLTLCDYVIKVLEKKAKECKTKVS
jgi:predicted HicB family RNase H-like nuclease